jgi:hypothetical protein
MRLCTFEQNEIFLSARPGAPEIGCKRTDNGGSHPTKPATGGAQLDPNCSKREAAQSQSSPCHPVIAVGHQSRSTRTFGIQRELRIRLWCETRLRIPYPAINPRANTGVINSTSWTTKTSRRWGA